MVNFVRATLAIQDYACREELSSNELSLLLAIFRVLNDQRFPEGMIEISNRRLLEKTTFNGSRRDWTLRETRQKLADRGVITFTAGDRRAQNPAYRINWEALGLAVEAESAAGFASDNCAKQDNINNKQACKKNVKERGARRPYVPNVEEVRAYAAEIGFTVNPLKFIDYCVMKEYRDWKAALRIWQFRENEQPGRRVTAQLYDQRRYTEQELESRTISL